MTTKMPESSSSTEPETETSPRKLRIITYLSPGIPLALFDLLRDYLEAETGLEAYLIYESRWSGPPPDRKDPFTTDEVDIAFMCTSGYLRLKRDHNSFMELCQAAPLHSHPKAAGKPVFFSDIIVHKNNQDRFKDFTSLKGCHWVYNDNLSLSGNLLVLAELRKRGYNASFFGSCNRSGSHVESIRMILNGRADAAAIDSNAMTGFKLEHPEHADSFHTVMTLGPCPIYPIVFNSRLPGKLKSQITAALMSINQKPQWGQQLMHLGVLGYTEVDESTYSLGDEVLALVKNMTITPAYY